MYGMPLLTLCAVGFGSMLAFGLLALGLIYAVRTPLYDRKQDAKINKLVNIQKEAYIAVQKELACAGWLTRVKFRWKYGKECLDSYRP